MTPTPTRRVDDLVKRIDAKIAELEEEERQEQAKLDKEKNEGKVTNNTTLPMGTNTIPSTTIAQKPINGITDDQFFDDFFADE